MVISGNYFGQILMHQEEMTMPRKGENIYKRLDGRWEGRYAIIIDNTTGKKKYHSLYGKTYSEVKKKLIVAKQGIATANRLLEVSKTKYKLAEWLQLWLNQYAKFNVKDSTFSNYYYCIHNHIIPKLGYFDLKQLTTFNLQVFFNEKLTNGRLDGKGGLSSKSVKDIHTILSAALKQALENNLIDKNPCLKIKLPTDKYSNIRVLSVDEQKTLEDAVLNSEHYLSIAIILALYTGLRLGEVCALQWKDIDLSNAILRVTSNLQRIKLISQEENKKTRIVIGTPKSSSSIRDIPFSRGLCRYLELKKKSNNLKFVVCNHEENFVDPRTVQSYFKKLTNRIGIESASFHTLRHTFATRAIEVGMDIKSVSEILGHADVSITLKKYVHSLTEHKRNQMQKIDILWTNKPSNF